MSLLNELNNKGGSVLKTATATTTIESTSSSNNNEETTVEYTRKTRPADSQLIPLNDDAFKFDKQGNKRLPRSAKQRKNTAINYIVDTLTNEKFQKNIHQNK